MRFALKALKADRNLLDARAMDDLRREVNLASDLRHDGIVAVYELVVDEYGRYYLKMELVDGGSLRDVRKLSWKQLVKFGLQACDALSYAHGKKVLHRDLKPGNLLIHRGKQLKIADFGLAVTLEDSLSQLSLKGEQTGTLLYMSPEQYRGKAVSAASDVYSLGATFYKLLAGQPPFRTRGFEHQLLNEPPAPLDDVPDWLNACVLDRLAKAPKERPASAAALATRLRAGEARPSVVARPASAQPRAESARPSAVAPVGWHG